MSDAGTTAEHDFDFDVVIVGSGFGGSVTALRLAEKGYSVAVIEKGKRWGPEDFPTTNWNIRKQFWLPWAGCYGTWSLHLLREALILHGVGVGGGSLLYAATLFEPPETVWQDQIWSGLEDWASIMPEHFNTARFMLGATDDHPHGAADDALKKVAENRGLGHTYKSTPVSIYFGDPDCEVPDPFFGGEGPPRRGCSLCGACMVGCKDGGKNTLDKNYLYFAEKKGVRVIPETKVDIVEPLADGGYRLRWRRSTQRFGAEKGELTGRKVILAAGVLGTVPLLMDCAEKGALEHLSPQLGNFVRTNSEALLGVTSRSKEELWKGIAIASKIQVDDVTHMECVRFPRGSDVMMLLGTTLTDGGGSVPRQLKWLGNMLRHPIETLRISKPWGKAESSVVLMAMQTLDNYTRLVKKRQPLWPFTRAITSQPPPGQPGIPSYLPLANEVARELSVELDAIPQSSLNEVLLNTSTTAHILGGCAIAADREQGVVDSSGQVFGYEGLYVADGSMIGANLGVNPSLTITAMAEHVASRIPAKGLWS